MFKVNNKDTRRTSLASFANQLTGFYIIATLAFNELIY